MDRSKLTEKYVCTTVLDLGDGDTLSISHGKFLNFAGVLPFADAVNASEEEKRDALLGALLSTLVDWDLTDGGEKVPCTPENIEWLVKILPADLLIPLFNQVMENIVPNARSAASSGAGSGSEEDSADAPIGTPSSELPDTSE